MAIISLLLAASAVLVIAQNPLENLAAVCPTAWPACVKKHTDYDTPQAFTTAVIDQGEDVPKDLADDVRQSLRCMIREKEGRMADACADSVKLVWDLFDAVPEAGPDPCDEGPCRSMVENKAQKKCEAANTKKECKAAIPGHIGVCKFSDGNCGLWHYFKGNCENLPRRICVKYAAPGGGCEAKPIPGVRDKKRVACAEKDEN